MSHRFKHLHCHQSGPAGDLAAAPEAREAVDVLRREVHVAGQLIGQAANLPTSHGVGLAGDREGPHSGPADASGGQMAVDDGIALVCAGGGLVDALRVEAHRSLGVGEPLVELFQLAGRQSAGLCRRCQIAGAAERCLKAFGVLRDEVLVQATAGMQEVQQACEDEAVRAGPDCQVQVGAVAAGGATRIDHHNAHLWSQCTGRHDSLVEHRVGPGSVGANQDQQVTALQILVAAGHSVGSKGALVGGHRGGHAQPRIGVDISRANEALHQFIGHVVVLGQQLPGQVEGHCVRTVLLDHAGEAGSHGVQGGVPVRAALADLRVQQPAVLTQGLMQRRSLDAKATQIGRMLRIPLNDLQA